MQKVIAVSIDVNQLVSQSDHTFSMAELDELNDVLEEGWEIEDWSFLTDDPVNGRMPMLVVLNDQMLPGTEELYEEWEEEEVPEEEEEDEEA